MSNLYATLGLDRNAQADEIKRAYRKKTVEWHPDKHGGSEEATEKFQEIQHAYDVLSDAKRRAMYDLGMPDPSDAPQRQWGDRFGFKSTGDVRQDLVVTSASFAELVVHNVRNGAVKNSLLAVLGVTAAATAGWWGWVLAILAGASIFWSAKSWIRVIAKSPMVTPSTDRR